MTLTPEALDRYARDYYLSDEVADIDIEERAQRLSAPTVAAHVRDARRVIDMGYGTGEMARELLAAASPPRWWRARPCSPPRRASGTRAWSCTRRCSRTSPRPGLRRRAGPPRDGARQPPRAT